MLAQAGVRFEVRPARIVEELRAGEGPVEYVTRLAREKAEHVYRLLGGAKDDSLVVLGADTTVAVEDAILGKPADAADAARMLRLLSGRAHRVATGVALVSSVGVRAEAEVTKVWFQELKEAEIAAYVATGEPMDKAGAYAIQGLAARWIPRIDGCYFNVVGLPIARFWSMAEEVSAKLGKSVFELIG